MFGLYIWIHCIFLIMFIKCHRCDVVIASTKMVPKSITIVECIDYVQAIEQHLLTLLLGLNYTLCYTSVPFFAQWVGQLYSKFTHMYRITWQIIFPNCLAGYKTKFIENRLIYRQFVSSNWKYQQKTLKNKNNKPFHLACL